MTAMTPNERFRRMFEHREADRVPIYDEPWAATIERWRLEGMPAGDDFVECLGLDPYRILHVDPSPRYPVRKIEETDEYVVVTSKWGTTQKQWKHAGGTPEFLHHTVVDPDSWRKARQRMTPTADRFDFDLLKVRYEKWRRENAWIVAGLMFGFDVTHSWMVGTERLLIAMVEQPEWVAEMFQHELDVTLALLDLLWEKGFTFDSIMWWDDMGYKGKQFFGMDMYRELLKPSHRRAIEWAKAHGIKSYLHSCGNIVPFVPELVGMGLDALNPIEVKAGMDPLALKAEYGGRLALHGGINVALWHDVEAVLAEMRRLVPTLKKGGGYIFASDHSIPSSVSYADFRRIYALAKELGSYE
jgi:uroporphyrinogen decarboxylase